MKNKISNFKKLCYLITAWLVISIIIFSCNKDSSASNSNQPITDDEISASVTEAVSPSSGGLVAQTSEAVVIVNTSSVVMNCGDTKDTAVMQSGSISDSITYSYNLKVSSTLNCSNGIPQSFDMSFVGSNSYTSPRISSTDSASGSWNVTGLQPSASSYVFNESYMRKGTQASKVRYQRSITSTIAITTSDLTVDKLTQKIVSGTAAVEYTGSSNGNSITRGGTLTFTGNSQAKLTLDDDNTYIIIW